MEIGDVYRFYDSKIAEHSAALRKWKSAVRRVGTARLLVFASALVFLWLCRDEGFGALAAVAAAFSLPFLLLVAYHAKLFARCAYEEEALRLNEDERKALDYDFSAFDGAAEEADSQHPFSLDLDLFGEKSLFQSANRTVTEEGRRILVDLFKRPLDDKDEILRRQESVRELCGLAGFRQDFYVSGKVGGARGEASLSSLKSFQNSRQRGLSGGPIWKILARLVPAVWVLLVAGCAFGGVEIGFIGMYAVVAFAIANLPARQVQSVYKSANKTERVLKKYSLLIEKIEQQEFESGLLREYRRKLCKEDGPRAQPSASKAIKALSRHIGALDQRYSAIGVILNVLCLRDVRLSIELEEWREKHSGDFAEWLGAVGAFDAFCSLGGFAFNHPGYIYPDVSDVYFEMAGEGLGHPLLHRDKCVTNGVAIPRGKFFLIVTGANMAGKSTFLRTVGVNFLLACMGAPVYAKSLAFYPAHLVTSLRTSDSLASSESYFFAELKRLKMIIDRLEAGEKLFVILDEILKGTNSVDKQKGSFGLMKKLIRKGACGVVATHDLLLGSLAEAFPENVRNKCFEADISDGELSFSYKLQDGVAQNMNASSLMRKMGISDE